MVRPPSTAARRTTMSYTLAEAAAACGLDKSTVRRAVRSGRISGTRDDLGVWHVEAAELHRVFPPVQSPTAVTGAMPPPRTAPATPPRMYWCANCGCYWSRAWETQVAQQRQLAAPQPKGWWRWLRT